MEGHLHPDWARVAERFAKYTGGEKHYGGAVCVYHHGEKVVDIWNGARNAQGDPWQEDTLSMSFSTTKGVTATALHLLADRGEVDYDEPVATYWPDFAEAGKAAVTVRDLLSHQAGLHRVRGLVDDVDDVLDWDLITKALAAQASDPPPGTGPGYHAITFGWLVGEVVRRVSGRTVGTVVREDLAGPLGVDGLHIGLPESEIHRIAPLLPEPTEKQTRRTERVLGFLERRGWATRFLEAMMLEDFNDLVFDPTFRLPLSETPAVSGMFDARSLARLYAMIGNDGELDGVRIFEPGRSAEMGIRQTQGRDYVIGIDMKWRLGYHHGFVLGRQSPTAFGHFGYGGSGGWCDPVQELAVGFVTNDMSGGSTPFADVRLARLGGVAQKIARKLG